MRDYLAVGKRHGRTVAILLGLCAILCAPSSVLADAAVENDYATALRDANYELSSGDVNGDGRVDFLLRARNEFGFVADEYTIPVWQRWHASFVILSQPDGSYALTLRPSFDLLQNSAWKVGDYTLEFQDLDLDGTEEVFATPTVPDIPTISLGDFIVGLSPDDATPTLWNASDTAGALAQPGLQAATRLDVAKTATFAGATRGSFDVSATGAATYEIPIWMPSGPNGVQPALSIRYDSRGSPGIMGPGWAISGLGSIHRCNKTFAQDAAPAPILLASTDGYCLDGKRLRLTSGTYGSASSTYQTELADFSKVTAYGAAGNGPAYFFVQGKDGLTYEYGNSSDSRIMASGKSTPYQWRLSKVRDRDGNNYVVTYGTGQSGSVGVGVPLSISYTRTSSSAITYRYNIVFEYQADTDDGTEVRYVAGGSAVNKNLLTAISVQRIDAGTVTLRKYSLGYATSPETNRSRLIFVQECADSGLTKCLPQTKVTYLSAGGGLQSTSRVALSSTSSVKGAYDFNGDGWDDILYKSADTLYVTFAVSDGGYGSPVSTGITLSASDYYDAGDLVASGQDDILVTRSGVWHRYYWNGSAFSAVSTGLSIGSGERVVDSALADVNGDGLPDLVTTSSVSGSSFNVYSRLNTSNNSTLAFSSARASTTISCTGFDRCIGGGIKTQSGRSNHEKLDFNGDGRNDIYLQVVGLTGNEAEIGRISRSYASNGTTFEFYGELPSATATFVNWNDDSCTDVVFGSTLRVSACNGLAGQDMNFSGAFLAVMDWDGDGRSDLLLNSSGNIAVRRSTGGGMGALTTTTLAAPANPIVFDQNGDGLDDLAGVGASSPYALTFRLHNGTKPPDLATMIQDGHGVYFSPTYTSIAKDAYTKGSGGLYPERNIEGPIYVVKSYSTVNGIGSNYTRYFSYAAARENVQGRGFSGFQLVNVTDSRADSLSIRRIYQQTFPFTGMLIEEDVNQHNGITPVATTSNGSDVKTLSSTAYQQRYFVYVSNSTNTRYEVGGTKNGSQVAYSTTSFSYDNYGNLTSSVNTLNDTDSAFPPSPTYGQSWTTTVSNTITPNLANWCLGIPAQRTVTRSATGVAAITRTIGFTPDYSKCRVTQAVVEPSSSTYKVTFGYGYDVFGNISSQTVTGVSMTGRSTRAGWGTTGQFPVSITNALNQTTGAGYDYNLDVQTSLTDPNNIAVNWTYDEFGRLKSEVRPDTTSTTYTYNDCASVSGGCQNGDPYNSLTAINKLVVIATDKDAAGNALRDDWTYLDQFGRTIATKSKTMGGGYSRIGTQYDEYGRFYRQTAPCDTASCSIYWGTLSYDALNRLTQQSRPVSAADSSTQNSTMSYQGMTFVTTDPQGKTMTKVFDPNGWLRQSKDHNGYYQAFQYDAFGSLKSVTDSQSNALYGANYDYGLDAFRRQTSDMDMGTWNYTPNALGEVGSYTDANGSTFSLTYDKLSRPLTQSTTSLSTTWTWGASATDRNIGQLQALASSTAANTTTESYTYDIRGRLSRQRIVSDATYDYDFAYSATTGYLDALTYPTSTSSYRLKLQYGYQNGLPKQISDYNASATVFWKADTTNPRGQVTKETLGNGIIASYGFDAVTGWRGSVQAGKGGGSGNQNETYAYDKIGNLTQRRNVTQNLTETFYYDNLYRLDYSQLNGVTNLDLSYDALGNITQRCEPTCGATWIYDAAKKHAVTQASVGSTTYTYGYNNNGNVTTRNGYAISWDRYNYPTLIKGPNESVGLYYDGNHSRWKQLYVQGSVTETTIYAGQLLEKVTSGSTTDWRHSIRANGKVVAIVSRKSTGTNATNYILEDHQGSVAKITNSSGSTVIGESFTAFGARRNPSTWSGAPSSTDLNTINALSRDGYTGHTALGNLGLNHMNGRVQDALTGRFLSPDPYITQPWNTQGYNRYSYVNSNPLSFVDPSGFFGCPAFQQGKELCIIVCLSCEEGVGSGGGASDSGGGASGGDALGGGGLSGPGAGGGVSGPQFSGLPPGAGLPVGGLPAGGFPRGSSGGLPSGGGGGATGGHGRILSPAEMRPGLFGNEGQTPGISYDASGNIVGEVGLSTGEMLPWFIGGIEVKGVEAAIGAAKVGAEIIAKNGTRIGGFTRHGVDRAIGDAASRAGTKPQAILDALKNPTKVVGGVDKQGRPFQIFTGQNARVVVNPETGQIVSVNPLSRLGAQP